MKALGGLKRDKNEIFRVACAASKGADYVLHRERGQELRRQASTESASFRRRRSTGRGIAELGSAPLFEAGSARRRTPLPSNAWSI